MFRLFVFFIFFLSFFSCSEAVHKTDRPNVLLIMVDDMGYGDIGISGNEKIKTPQLDAFSKTAVRFKNFYVSPVCAPTRASLLTGRYHQRTGIRSVTNGFEIMDPNEVTIAEILKENGYRTGIFGKWHVGEYYPSVPNAQGFEEYLGFRTGHTANYYDAVLEHNGQPKQTRGYITDVLTDAAISFIKNSKDQPFFCYLPYNAPHTPLFIDSNYFKPYLEAGFIDRTARIYGMMENIDENIGRLLTWLEEQNIAEKTIVIFLSDNGPIDGWRKPPEECRYNAGLRDQKFTIYEGGIRTQCFWKWGGHWNGGQSLETVGAHIDILPTLLDLTEIPLPDSLAVDGKSLKPLLEGYKNDLDDRTFYQKYALQTLRNPGPFPGGIARKGPWKMVNGVELYNLHEDPGEQNNLAIQKPEMLQELTDTYLRWYDDIQAAHQLQKIIIQVGHPEENPLVLQPHHGEAEGGIQFFGIRGLTGERIGRHPSGVDGDWATNWASFGDAVNWDLDFKYSGTYTVKLKLRGDLPLEANFNLQVGDKLLRQKLSPEDLMTFPKGSAEVDGHWSFWEIGKMEINKGKKQLQLKLMNDLGKNTLEIRAIALERQIF